MIDDELAARVMQLYQVENLSMRQIAAYCGMCTKTVSRIIHSEGVPLRNRDNDTTIVPYRRLIEAWYSELPKLKACQVYERRRIMNIISASRRTDIPHFFHAWFNERRKEGFAEYRTVFGGGKNGRFYVSLKAEDVLGYLFWTKFAGPFQEQLEILRSDGIPYVFQYTLTGYGKEIQPGIPGCSAAIDDFLKLSENLPGAAAIQWRYDPILVSSEYDVDWHRGNFEQIADKLQGGTRVVNVSFIEPYLKALTKAPDWHSIRWRKPDPVRHKTALNKYPEIRAIGPEEDELLADLAEIAGKRGIELRVCCNQEYDDSFPTARCCGLELFQAYGTDIEKRVSTLAPGPSRPGCRCLKTVDIGMDTTCPGGCFYCYVTTSIERAMRNYELHDPNATMMR